MTDVEFSKLLSQLSSTAATLNRDSDSINEIIATFQETLRKLNVGLEAWVDAALATEKWSEDDGARRGTNDDKLGFAKVGAEWALVVRQEVWERDQEDQSWDVIETYQPVRLLEASRAMRLKALPLFPALLKQLQHEAEEALRAIEEAKKFVK